MANGEYRSVRLESGQDDRLEAIVPDRYKGRGKVSERVYWALEQFFECCRQHDGRPCTQVSTDK